MPFNLFITSQQSDISGQSADRAEAFLARDAAEKSTPIKESAADKKETAEKESSVAEKTETDSRKDRIKQESNSKEECRYCGETTLHGYGTDYDEDGEEIISNKYCLNCGFNFPYFSQFEKEEKKKTGGDGSLGTGFIFLVLLLFTIILVKGEGNGFFNNDEAPSATNRTEDVRSPRTDTADPSTARVLNDAEPFELSN